MTLGAGVDRIDLHYFGRGHTNGDAWVLFPAARVLLSWRHLLRQEPAAARLQQRRHRCRNFRYADARVQSRPRRTWIRSSPATAPSMTPNDLREYSDFNRDFRNAVFEAKKSGRSVDDIVRTWRIPDLYKGYAAPDPVRPARQRRKYLQGGPVAAREAVSTRTNSPGTPSCVRP